MANENTTSTLADSLPVIRQSARIVTELSGTMTSPDVVEVIQLEENQGLSWNEISLAKITAQPIGETTCLDNPKRFCDTLLQVTPTLIGIQTVITDRVRMRVSSNVAAQWGQLTGNAINRKMNQDGHTVLDGATTSLGGGACAALDAGELVAAAVRIDASCDAPVLPGRHAVLHPYAIHDIWSEIVQIGTGTGAAKGVTASITQLNGSSLADSAFTQGQSAVGTVGGVSIHKDSLISTSGSAAKGGVFSHCGVLLVRGRSPRIFAERKNSFGGGADVLFHYEEFAFGERAAGNRLFEIHSDATAPAG